MTDYVSYISTLLNQGIPVIFYTVGSGTFGYIRELKNRFGKKPTAVCDGDTRKQGKTFRGLDGIQVISPQEAMEHFSNCYFFICSLDYRYQIIGYLTESCGIASERIINYVPVKKVRSCSFLQKALIYDQTGDLRFCWRNPSPKVSASENVDATALLTLRNTLLQELEDPQTQAQTLCDGCPQICEEYYPESPLSWSLNYFCYSRCNYKCSYCTLRDREDGDFHNGEQPLGTLIEIFKDVGLMGPDYSVILSTAGEPSIHPKRKEFYDAFDGAELVVNTNGFVFDTDLYAAMQTKKVLLVCSVDAGTAETYAKIKAVDGLAQVQKNLTHYAQSTTGIVALKYIFVPGTNDTPADIDGFVDLCINTGALFVIVSIDYFSMGNVSQKTRDMIHRLSQELSRHHILCVPYTAWETAEYNSMMRELLQ